MGLDILGHVLNAQGQANRATYMAQVARNQQLMAERQAEIDEREARDIEQQGVLAEDQQRLRTAAVIGKQRAGLAAQGGDVTQGSALDIVGDTAHAGELAALTLRNDVARRKYRTLIGAARARNAAGLADAESRFQGGQSAAAFDRLPLAVARTALGGGSLLTGGL